MEKLSVPQRSRVLEGVISFLDRDLMELRDDYELERKQFLKKIKQEKKRQMFQKRDPSPGDVLVP